MTRILEVRPRAGLCFATQRCGWFRRPARLGFAGIVVHAISEEARRFYLALGFEEYPGQVMMLVVTVGDLRVGLG